MMYFYRKKIANVTVSSRIKEGGNRITVCAGARTLNIAHRSPARAQLGNNVPLYHHRREYTSALPALQTASHVNITESCANKPIKNGDIICLLYIGCFYSTSTN
ncbi:hypothetical protein O0L34_g8127 [Tuta absoluta]|nr:hypothetical protein O0L34_g8127 [Tuta absoluta]